jgi:hypothetical protein
MPDLERLAQLADYIATNPRVTRRGLGIGTALAATALLTSRDTPPPPEKPVALDIPTVVANTQQLEGQLLQICGYVYPYNNPQSPNQYYAQKISVTAVLGGHIVLWNEDQYSLFTISESQRYTDLYGAGDPASTLKLVDDTQQKKTQKETKFKHDYYQNSLGQQDFHQVSEIMYNRQIAGTLSQENVGTRIAAVGRVTNEFANSRIPYLVFKASTIIINPQDCK